MTITLLAMSPSGEAYFTRDSQGIVRRHRPLGRHEPVEVGEHVVAWAVDRYGYDRVDEDVDSWLAVERLVDRRLERTTVDGNDLPVTPNIARSAVRVMERWLETPADRALITPTVHRLLREGAVAGDDILRTALLDLAARATAEPASLVNARPSLLRTTRDAVRTLRHDRALGFFSGSLAA